MKVLLTSDLTGGVYEAIVYPSNSRSGKTGRHDRWLSHAEGSAAEFDVEPSPIHPTKYAAIATFQLADGHYYNYYSNQLFDDDVQASNWIASWYQFKLDSGYVATGEGFNQTARSQFGNKTQIT